MRSDGTLLSQVLSSIYMSHPSQLLFLTPSNFVEPILLIFFSTVFLFGSTLVKEGLFDIVKTIFESSDESFRLIGFVSKFLLLLTPTQMLCRNILCRGYICGESLLSCLLLFCLGFFPSFLSSYAIYPSLDIGAIWTHRLTTLSHSICCLVSLQVATCDTSLREWSVFLCCNCCEQKQ